ncbi:hypothetical protein F2Q69_00035969, partial [Brassica cretica]
DTDHMYFCLVLLSFQSRHGKSYLFSKVANVDTGKKKDRMMMPGLHTVVNIYFVKSGFYVGWRYKKKTFNASLFFFPLAFDYLNVSWFETYRTIWITQEDEAGESDTYD